MAEELEVKETAAKASKAAKPAKPSKVIVVSKFDRFVDLIMDVEITRTPKSVVMHPWLEAQVESGLVIKC